MHQRFAVKGNVNLTCIYSSVVPKKKVSLPHNRSWEIDFRKYSVQFIGVEKTREIINIVNSTALPEVPNEIMYERAHRKMMDLI